MPRTFFSPRGAARLLAIGATLTGLAISSAGLAGPASAASGTNNKGDVWLDNVGQPPGPGHEHDPHLACQDINLWGDKLSGSSGTYTIDGWPPSGTKKQAYASTWSYDQTAGGDQVTSVIPVQTLIANAEANGDAPVNKQGFHFKLQFSLFPQKHKTFWVNCPGTPPPPPPTGSISVCQTTNGYLPSGDIVHYTVGTEDVDVPAGSCTTAAGTFPSGSSVTVVQNIPSGLAVTGITVDPVGSITSEDLSTGSATVTVGTGTTTLTYTDHSA
jgi:hypothetical protein